MKCIFILELHWEYHVHFFCTVLTVKVDQVINKIVKWLAYYLYLKFVMQFDNQAQSLEEARKSLELARKDLEAEKDLNGKHEDVIKKNRLTIDEQALSMKSTIDLYVSLYPFFCTYP